MERHRTWVRRAGFALLALLLLAGAGILLLPRLLTGVVEREARKAVDSRGIPVTWETLRLDGLGRGEARRLCIHDLPPNDDHILGCLDHLAVEWNRDALLRGRMELLRVEASDGWIDLGAGVGTPAAFAARWRAHLSRDRASDETPEPAEPRATRAAWTTPEIVVDRIDLRAPGRGLPMDAVRLLTLRTRADDEAAHVEATLQPTTTALALAPAAIRLPESLRVTGSRGPAGWKIRIAGDTPVEGVLPAANVTVRVGAIGAESPWAIVVEDLALDVGDAVATRVDRAQIDVQAWTTDIEQLHFSRLQLDGLHATLHRLADGAIVLPPAAGGSAEAADPKDPPTRDGTGDTAGEAPSPDLAPTRPWANRKWYQMLPQETAIRGSTLRVERAGAETVELRDLELGFAMRILRMQMDATLRASIHHGDKAAGRIATEVVWAYSDQAADVKLDLGDVDLSLVSTLLPDAPRLAGALTLAGTYREGPKGRTVETAGKITVSDLIAEHPALRAPLDVGTASWSWRAEKSGRDEPLRFTEGSGTLRGAAFALRPTIHAWKPWKAPRTRRIDVDFEIPVQPAMTLFDAVPPSLRDTLTGTRMRGDFGLGVTFGVARTPAPDGPWRIEPPTRSVFRDETLALEALPEAVDVRRLNDRMTFTFRGPNDAVNRVLTIPHPDAVEDTLAREPGTRRGRHAWVPLDRIAWSLIAMHLFREDGRFFTNTGVNWTQLREVLGNALNDGRIERGASTISMQLVKNVFLTHERSIERKVQELFLTYWLTRTVPKARILEVYFNIIEWGPEVNGIAEAARYYFGRHPSELTLAEATWLSAAAPSPLRRAAQRETGRVPEWAMRQIRDLIGALQRRGLITLSEARRGQSEPVRFVRPGDSDYIPAENALPPSALGLTPADPSGVVGDDASTDVVEDEANGPLPPLLQLAPQDRIRALIESARPPRGPGPDTRGIRVDTP